jgi:aspartate-semialdehyde dehydrogenase
MDRKFKVGIAGGTGMVGQRFALLLENHPWFEVAAIAASPRSAGLPYGEAVRGRWHMEKPVPESMKGIVVLDASDVEAVTSGVDFLFCAVDMDKAATRKLEEDYARAETPVVSNNSANRMVPDVPMTISEINHAHAAVVETQRKRLGTKRGFITVKPNCSIQSYVPALHPLREFGLTRVLACTYQAISGASKTFETMPEIVDNVIPYIPGEEEKSEREPLKIWGEVKDGAIVNASGPDITSQCLRVPVRDGHLAAVFASFEKKPSRDEIISRWRDFESLPAKLGLPSAPDPFLVYFDEPDRPQTKLDRDLGNGMAVSMGRLREDTQYDWKFICLSHNTLRGAAGGGVLAAEMMVKQGYIIKK